MTNSQIHSIRSPLTRRSLVALAARLRAAEPDPGVLIESRVRRQTGTTVEVWRDLDDDAPYTDVCNEHAGTCGFDTRKQAIDFASVPIEWCPGCQVAAGIADGTPEGHYES